MHLPPVLRARPTTRHRLTWRTAICSASAVAMLLGGCSSDGSTQAADTTAGAESTVAAETTIAAETTAAAETTIAAETTVAAATAESTPAAPTVAPVGDVAVGAVPADVCVLFDAAVLSGLVGEAVEGTVVGTGVCQFSGTDPKGMLPTIAVRTDSPGGLDAAQAGAESTIGVTGQPFDADGSPGFLVVGGGNGPAVGAATVHGLLVTVAVVAGEPAAKSATLSSMLRTAVGAL